MGKTWKIGYKDEKGEKGETVFLSIQGSCERPTKSEAANALLAKLSNRFYGGNNPESIQRQANNLLESEGYTIVSIVPDDEAN
ncbi:hypothetical protein [Janthinobacterium sp. BJB304]|uniref:hypothetical protein n=1 Tax=Janthinobacterium sp. BJB304 TaxID=1572871 RepID=UPI00117B79EE|nr:hypothetical protein [Janthinobacterium sp. BJB304]